MYSINLKILVYFLLFLYLSVTFVSASESNKNSEIENVIRNIEAARENNNQENLMESIRQSPIFQEFNVFN